MNYLAPYNKFPRKSGWPSGLRRCVQVAVSPGGVGSNPTSDNPYIFVLSTSAENLFHYIVFEVSDRNFLLTFESQMNTREENSF